MFSTLLNRVTVRECNGTGATYPTDLLRKLLPPRSRSTVQGFLDLDNQKLSTHNTHTPRLKTALALGRGRG